MRYFRRLPPALRVASIGGLLFLLVALALSILGVYSSVTHLLSPSPPVNGDVTRLYRVWVIALNLGLLAQACALTVSRYSARFRRPDRAPFPLDSWQSQVQAIARLSALPLGGIVLALLIPVTSLAFVVVLLILVILGLAADVLLVFRAVAAGASLAGEASSGPMRTPQTG